MTSLVEVIMHVLYLKTLKTKFRVKGCKRVICSHPTKNCKALHNKCNLLHINLASAAAALFLVRF